MGTTDQIKTIMNKTAMNYLPWFMIGFIIILCIIYIARQITLNERNCTTLSSLYTTFPSIKSIDYESTDFDYNLRDFYVKSAYNCCCGGNFKNDYVNICALESVLKNGARFLDFEIYSKNNKPVIGASSDDNFTYKETYNHLEFKTVMDKIKANAFSALCPNPDDPIILHFRIKSESTDICDEMAKDLHYTFGQRHLDKTYSYEFRGNNLGEVSIKDLKSKVIVAVDKSNTKFKSTKLYEFVNICSNSEDLRSYRSYDIEQATDTEEIANHNKLNMSIVLPDYKAKNNNYSYMIPKESGVQFMAMNFQNFDSSLKQYSLFFDAAGYAFVLKPEDLRPEIVDVSAGTPLAQGLPTMDDMDNIICPTAASSCGETVPSSTESTPVVDTGDTTSETGNPYYVYNLDSTWENKGCEQTIKWGKKPNQFERANFKNLTLATQEGDQWEDVVVPRDALDEKVEDANLIQLLGNVSANAPYTTHTNYIPSVDVGGTWVNDGPKLETVVCSQFRDNKGVCIPKGNQKGAGTAGEGNMKIPNVICKPQSWGGRWKESGGDFTWTGDKPIPNYKDEAGTEYLDMYKVNECNNFNGYIGLMPFEMGGGGDPMDKEAAKGKGVTYCAHAFNKVDENGNPITCKMDSVNAGSHTEKVSDGVKKHWKVKCKGGK